MLGSSVFDQMTKTGNCSADSGKFYTADTLKDDWQGSDGCVLATEVLASGQVIYIMLWLKEK